MPIPMQRRFCDLKNQTFDLLVVGGGVYGAWTAYDAALRGLSTALVEQGDWAGATSSASTKLIHGGLRYLEQGNLKLVRKALAERKRLMRVCPHRVRPLRFGIPIYAGSRLKAWRLRLGLSLYDWLGGSPGLGEEAHSHVPREEFIRRFPWIRAEALESGALYGDAQTDDTRFVLELVDGALAAGAVCVNYGAVVDYRDENGRAVGAIVKDRVGGEQTLAKARCIVRTTGPWLALPGLCRLSKGVHLIMPPLPGEDALLFFSEADGRVVFLIPWYGFTLLGTTDTDYRGDPEKAGVEPEDVAYLLDAANRVLGSTVRWDASQVLGGFAGLRVLRGGADAWSYSLRRDWSLEEAADGALVSVGGKLTSARQDAAAIVDRACRRLDVRASSATGTRLFPWAPAEDYAVWSREILARGRSLGLADEDVRWLGFRHGRRIGEIYAAVERNPALGARLFPEVPCIRADFAHCARNEMVVHLEDLLRRRMPLLLLHRFNRAEAEALADEVAPLLEWDEPRRHLEAAHCLAHFRPPSVGLGEMAGQNESPMALRLT
jgi:glycerol-3-phosphate dehydrogenase